MWNRKELKEKAKLTFTSIYWKSVLAAVIFDVFTYIVAGRRHHGPNGETAWELISSWQIGVLIASIFTFALFIGILLTIFVQNPIKIGYARFLLDSTEKEPEDVKVKTLLSYFLDGQYTRVLVAIFTTQLIKALFMLLLVVPGIIKSYQYRLVPYLLAEDCTLTGKEVRAKSKAMMAGQKWRTFILDLSFIGWHFLSAITFGLVGIFWVTPYYRLTDTYLYKTIKEAN